jgi:hypothetical protein
MTITKGLWGKLQVLLRDDGGRPQPLPEMDQKFEIGTPPLMRNFAKHGSSLGTHPPNLIKLTIFEPFLASTEAAAEGKAGSLCVVIRGNGSNKKYTMAFNILRLPVV